MCPMCSMCCATHGLPSLMPPQGKRPSRARMVSKTRGAVHMADSNSVQPHSVDAIGHGPNVSLRNCRGSDATGCHILPRCGSAVQERSVDTTRRPNYQHLRHWSGGRFGNTWGMIIRPRRPVSITTVHPITTWTRYGVNPW